MMAISERRRRGRPGAGRVVDVRDEADRGREATGPQQIPPRGWRDVLLRLRRDLKEDQVPLVAAGVAFYAMLSLFPAMIAAISVYGLVVDPQQVADQVKRLTEIIPQDAANLIAGQLDSVARSTPRNLGVGLVVSVLVALWSASSGMKALVAGVNIAYDEHETRGFLKLRGLALALTAGAIVVVALALAAAVAFPAIVGELPGGDLLATAASWLRWPILAAFVIAGLAVLFRLAPDRDHPRFRWVSGGALVATAFWLLASVGFSFYVDNFGSYNQTYGSIAAVAILMLWLYLTAFLVLVGAELNSQLELQTRRDSTTGAEQPLGERGAVAADTVAERPPARRERS
ncbi:MAG TPA: YihY/virulence factor BrkB family protein [Actinomycetes bacterium]|nr:YihY/virulence factor BrkB family protein [Actinomycetes bacterium]